MEDNLEAWRAVTRRYGLELKPDDYYPFEGLPMQEIAKQFFNIHDAPCPNIDELVKLKDEWYLKNHHFSFYPGVEELIDALAQRKVLMGIVTAGLRDRLEKSVPCEFLEQFIALVTGEMTQRGKPHPDSYLKGAKELGLRTEECIVVENAPLGIQAAKAAKCYCVAVCSTVDRRYLTEADDVVDQFEDLKNLPVIRRMLAS
jgi:beta-phosphoglucomutase